MRPRSPLPVYGSLPDFTLRDEHDAAFTLSNLLGRVSIADFIFTRCTASCPRLTATMADVQGRLAREKSNIQLVSFSVDPEDDTPAVLAAYAAKAHADPARWAFVTGPADDVQRTIVFGFKMSAAKIARGAHDFDVTHGDWFVLVDRRGVIRGYYPVDQPKDVDVLVRDALRLERASSGS